MSDFTHSMGLAFQTSKGSNIADALFKLAEEIKNASIRVSNAIEQNGCCMPCSNEDQQKQVK